MLGALHEKTTEHYISSLGDTQLGLLVARIILSGAESEIGANHAGLRKAAVIIHGKHKGERGQATHAVFC